MVNIKMNTNDGWFDEDSIVELGKTLVSPGLIFYKNGANLVKTVNVRT